MTYILFFKKIISIKTTLKGYKEAIKELSPLGINCKLTVANPFEPTNMSKDIMVSQKNWVRVGIFCPFSKKKLTKIIPAAACRIPAICRPGTF